MADDLTPKQAAFVQEYIVDLNATKAAIRAGYSEKTAAAIGHENLTKPNIAEAIEKAQADRFERVEVTQDYVLESIVEVMECAKLKTTSNPAAVLKGAELLGKHLSMFTERHNVNLSGKLDTTWTVEVKDADDSDT